MKKLARQFLLLPGLIAAAKTPELGNLKSVTSLTTVADIMRRPAVPLAKIMFKHEGKGHVHNFQRVCVGGGRSGAVHCSFVFEEIHKPPYFHFETG